MDKIMQLLKELPKGIIQGVTVLYSHAGDYMAVVKGRMPDKMVCTDEKEMTLSKNGYCETMPFNISKIKKFLK